jgi:hypothetical protein
MNTEEMIEYKKREYCNALPCKVQVLLNQQKEGSKGYEQVRSICKTNCIHTTHEFHSWLIEKGYLVIRPAA